MSLIPVRSYLNADLQKSDICKDNNKKTGVYRWTHVISGKSYVGSALDLNRRFKNYYNREKQIKIIVWYIKHY